MNMGRKKGQCKAMIEADEGGYDYCILDEFPWHDMHKTWEGREFDFAIYVRTRFQRERKAPRMKRARLGVVERASQNALRRCGLTSWAPTAQAGERKP